MATVQPPLGIACSGPPPPPAHDPKHPSRVPAAQYDIKRLQYIALLLQQLACWCLPATRRAKCMFFRRLIGGVELMQAIGLKLEENGTVLALREDGHHTQSPKWDRVPQSVLKNLESASKVRFRLSCAGRPAGGFHPETFLDLSA